MLHYQSALRIHKFFCYKPVHALAFKTLIRKRLSNLAVQYVKIEHEASAYRPESNRERDTTKERYQYTEENSSDSES